MHPRPILASPHARYIEHNTRERHFDVDRNFAGWRLDLFLNNRLQRLSRTKAAEIIKHGDIELHPPRRLKPSLKLALGDRVTLREHLNPEWIQDDQVELLYQDETLIILNKPSGMLVHESVSTRLNTIQMYLKRHGEPEAEAVHRLDRETSGVLICARTHDVVAPLRALFASDHPDKIYRALVLDPNNHWGTLKSKKCTTPLGPQTQNDLDLRMGPGPLASTTHVRFLEHKIHPKFGPMSDLEVKIETGRQHQIRVHLEMEGTPIAGDKLYGQSDQFFMDIHDNPEDPKLLEQLPFPRHALHAWKVRLTSPKTHRKIEVTAPPPELVWNVF